MAGRNDPINDEPDARQVCHTAEAAEDHTDPCVHFAVCLRIRLGELKSLDAQNQSGDPQEKAQTRDNGENGEVVGRKRAWVLERDEAAERIVMLRRRRVLNRRGHRCGAAQMESAMVAVGGLIAVFNAALWTEHGLASMPSFGSCYFNLYGPSTFSSPLLPARERARAHGQRGPARPSERQL